MSHIPLIYTLLPLILATIVHAQVFPKTYLSTFSANITKSDGLHTYNVDSEQQRYRHVYYIDKRPVIELALFQDNKIYTIVGRTECYVTSISDKSLMPVFFDMGETPQIKDIEDVEGVECNVWVGGRHKLWTSREEDSLHTPFRYDNWIVHDYHFGTPPESLFTLPKDMKCGRMWIEGSDSSDYEFEPPEREEL